MGSFVSCYLIVWLAITLYVARLGVHQAALQQGLDRLQQQVDREQLPDKSAARAA
jgi:CcmD family protein